MGLYKRNEFFGSILYDSMSRDYYFCDDFTTYMLENRSIPDGDMHYDEIFERFGLLKSDCTEVLQEVNTIVKNSEIIPVNNTGKEGMLSAPLRVFLDITYACNLRCKHCFTSSGDKKNDELTLGEKKDVIDQMVDMGTFRISVGGGEPLLSNDFFPFAEYARSKGVDVSFSTNGTLLNRDIVRQLNDLQISTVSVSLDGANANDNDLIRGIGNYECVIENISMLHGLFKGEVAMRMTIMKHNTGNAEEFIALAKELKCKTVKFNPLRLSGRACDNPEFFMRPNDYISFIRRMETIKARGSENVRIVLPLNPFQKEPYDFIEELGFGCVAGKDCISISPEGFVTPCSQIKPEQADGNSKTDSLYDIWTKGSTFNFYRSFDGNDKCRSCEVYNKCRGGCRYRALQNGDINGVDPYCYLQIPE